MGNRKRFGVVNHEIVSDCVCDVRRAVGRSTQFFFFSQSGLQFTVRPLHATERENVS